MPAKKAKKAPKKRKTTKRSNEDVFEERMEHFGKEVEALGNKFGKKMEKKGEKCDMWFHRTFGIVGPLISSVFGIVILSLFVWVVNLVNSYLKVGLIYDINSFFSGNLALFFIIFMFFSYTSYFSKMSKRAYRPFSPVVTAMSVTIGFWILMNVINIVNVYLGWGALTTISFYIGINFHLIFMFFLLLGYLYLLTKTAYRHGGVCKERALEEDIVMKKSIKKQKPVGMKRLYRSGKDRILGGVCGGIAEYLGVDPVIIRLLWVIGSLAWGAGILFYIICWIIIPRNPTHKWKD